MAAQLTIRTTRMYQEGEDVDVKDEEQQEQQQAEAARRLRQHSLGSVQTNRDSLWAPSGSMMDREIWPSWFIDHSRLTIRKTFYHYEEDEEEEADEGRVQRLLRCRYASAPPRANRSARAGLSPASRDVAACDTGPAGPPNAAEAEEWRTSVLLRNVPYLLSRDMLVELLDSQGFKGKYDLVYMPRDFDRLQTLGYAIVNALNPKIALRLFQDFEGFHAWPVKCQKKVCTVEWCRRQGLQKNICFLRNSSVMHESVPEDFKPVLFLQGSQVPFPACTRKLRNIKCYDRGSRRRFRHPEAASSM